MNKIYFRFTIDKKSVNIIKHIFNIYSVNNYII